MMMMGVLAPQFQDRFGCEAMTVRQKRHNGVTIMSVVGTATAMELMSISGFTVITSGRDGRGP